MTTDEIITILKEEFEDDELLLADGFEEALIGTVDGGACLRPVACYDYLKCVEILMERDGMDEDAAAEFLDFNTLGSHGEGLPVFLNNLRAQD